MCPGPTSSHGPSYQKIKIKTYPPPSTALMLFLQLSHQYRSVVKHEGNFTTNTKVILPQTQIFDSEKIDIQTLWFVLTETTVLESMPALSYFKFDTLSVAYSKL